MTGLEDFLELLFPAILLRLLSVWDHIENRLSGAQVLDELLDGAQLDVTERLQVLTLIQGGHFPLPLNTSIQLVYNCRRYIINYVSIAN